MTRRRHPLTTARQANRTIGILLGDAQAIRRGRITERLTNRIIGRAMNHIARRMWR